MKQKKQKKNSIACCSYQKRLYYCQTKTHIKNQIIMTTQETLNKKFETLNKKYVKISKQMDKVANSEDTWEMEQQLDKIQEEMSKISAELELKGW